MKTPKVKGKMGLIAQPNDWFRWADEDYIAAQTLFLQGFVLQGTMLANTAIESI